MGNEMGNNNVIGQQVSEEGSKDFDKTMHHSDCSPGLNNINDKVKDDTKDVDTSEVLKVPLISNGGDEKMASDQTNLSAVNEDIDEKNTGSLQDHTSAQDDHVNSNLCTEEGDETQEESETEITKNYTEAVAPIGSTIEDMTSNKDTSSSDEQSKQPVHVSAEGSEEITLVKSPTLSEEDFEGLPEDKEESCSQEVGAVGGNLVGEDTVENIEEGRTRASTVYDLSTPSSVQGEATSSPESILTDYRDAETKDVVIEDEPRERGNPSYVRPEDDTNQETSKNEEKQETCEMGKSKSCKTTATYTLTESDEVLEEDKKIHGLENQEEELPKCSAYGALDTGDAICPFQSAIEDPSPINGKEFQKHVPSISARGEMSDPVSAAVEHNVTEITEKEQGGTVVKDAAYKNEADIFEGDKKSDGTHDSLSVVKINGEDFTGLGPPLSGPLSILNEEKVQEEVIVEESATPMTATLFAIQLEEDSVKEDIKSASSDINEGTTSSTYESKTTDTQETINRSQCDRPQQVLLEEPEVLKFENNETLSTCMQLVECSSATESIITNVFNKEREGTSDKAASFTSESYDQKVTGLVGFAAESKEKKGTANADKSTEEQCLLREPTMGRGAGEETPLLLSESIDSLSYSSEQHIKVVKDIPMANIAVMQAKDDAAEESEKSPLLSPREPSDGAFRAPNQSDRNNRPLHSLMTEDRVGMWSRLKGQEPVQRNSTTVSSPRSKEKQKPKPSIFAICLCCTTATN